MKRAINLIVITVFLLILTVMLLASNFDADAVSLKDNRKLAPAPSFISGGKLTDAIDSYFSDRIGFREELISLNSRLTYQLFKKSPVDRVFFGKDGWLFFKGDNNNGEPIAEYIGKKRYSEEQLKAIADNLEKTRAYLAQRNCEFVVFIGPNKEHVYSEYMPDIIQSARVSEYCCTDQLVDYLRKNTDVRVVYPYDELKKYIQNYPDEPVYYHLDTHWNALGGYIGARALLSELGIDIPAPEDTRHIKVEEKNTGDLYKALSCEDWLNMEDTEYSLPDYPAADTIVKEEDYNAHWRYYNKNKDPRKIMAIRDSFTSNMRLILGSCFDEADLIHSSSYDPGLIESEKPDIVVWERVERYQANFADPIIPQ